MSDETIRFLLGLNSALLTVAARPPVRMIKRMVIKTDRDAPNHPGTVFPSTVGGKRRTNPPRFLPRRNHKMGAGHPIEK